jgi:hypothetical protein
VACTGGVAPYTHPVPQALSETCQEVPWVATCVELTDRQLIELRCTVGCVFCVSVLWLFLLAIHMFRPHRGLIMIIFSDLLHV